MLYAQCCAHNVVPLRHHHMVVYTTLCSHNMLTALFCYQAAFIQSKSLGSHHYIFCATTFININPLQVHLDKTLIDFVEHEVFLCHFLFLSSNPNSYISSSQRIRGVFFFPHLIVVHVLTCWGYF